MILYELHPELMAIEAAFKRGIISKHRAEIYAYMALQDWGAAKSLVQDWEKEIEKEGV